MTLDEVPAAGESRALSMTVPLETLSVVLFRLGRLNAEWSAAGMPSWAAQVARDEDTATATLRLTADLPQRDGYTFHGVASRGEYAPLPGSFVALPDEVLGEVRCAVCGTRRAKRHYLLSGPDGVSALFVGEPCLPAFFTAHGEPGCFTVPVAPAMVLADPVALLTFTMNGVLNAVHSDVTAVLAAAMWLTDTHGYVSKARAEQTGRQATAHAIEDMASRVNGDGRVLWPEDVTDRLLAASVLRMCALDELPDDTDFDRQLKDALALGAVSRHGFGLLACLPTVYNRFDRETAARAAGEPAPGQGYTVGHVGTVGERVTLPGVMVEETRVLDSGSTLVVMRDADGHRLTWFAASAGGVPIAGEMVTVVGTVRAHKEFRGVTDTTLNRCVFPR
jgi:hypothetical protein